MLEKEGSVLPLQYCDMLCFESPVSLAKSAIRNPRNCSASLNLFPLNFLFITFLWAAYYSCSSSLILGLTGVICWGSVSLSAFMLCLTLTRPYTGS